MEIKKKVQFLKCSKNDSDLYCYDFLDLESNLPFTVYSMSSVESYEKLQPYTVHDLSFNLVLQKSKTGLAFKVKPFVKAGV